MPGLTCNACNKVLIDENDQKKHYKSEWHRFNLKRKIAGVPGVTDALFLARQSAIAEEESKLSEPPMLYTCSLCGKGYRTSMAHAQHLKSRAHISRASENEITAIITPLPPNKHSQYKQQLDNESDEWEEVDQTSNLVSETTSPSDEEEQELDPTSCFMCDQNHKTIENCMIHMHRHHGFFVPDVEYLKDPRGLLTYLGLKVKRDYECLYCNINSQPFNSLEAVRKHMAAKSHCRVHYGDGDDEEEEAELDEFYDYSTSYIDRNGKQLVTADGTGDSVELGSSGSELVITRTNDDRISTIAIGSREYLRYYRQKPRPLNGITVTRYRSMDLSTVYSKENMVRMKNMNKLGVEVMRCKIGMKSNVIHNLPRNVTY
ncbi:hypothetical protein LXL04_025877 [Taraxacum kok-saghyz]